MTDQTNLSIPTQPAPPRRVALWLARSLWSAVTLLVAGVFVAMLPGYLAAVRFS